MVSDAMRASGGDVAGWVGCDEVVLSRHRGKDRRISPPSIHSRKKPMRTFAVLLVGVVSMLGFGCGKSDKDATQGSLTKEVIEGTWIVESWDEPTRHSPGPRTKGLKFVFTAHTLTFFNGSDPTEDPYKIDSNSRPKSIDVSQTREVLLVGQGPPTPKIQTTTTKGVYSLDGDTLKLCFGSEETGRPTDFESKPGRVVIVLKRAK
jgi:uncharacterized protein (TIGR03067 family)